MATFKIAGGDGREPVSPLDAPTMDFPSPSKTHVFDQWRPSIDTVASEPVSAVEDKPAWAPPPLPPIPREKEPEAWRKRSLKRCSLASQLSNYSTSELPSDLANKHRRKMSVVSLDVSVKSTPSRNFSRPTRCEDEQSRPVDLNWKMATYNPQNWPSAKKWFHTIAVGTAAFTCTLASSIIPPSFKFVDGRFGSSSVIFVLPLALFPAGLAFGPTFNTLLSEIIGRKVVLIASMAAFALVTLGSAFVVSFWPVVACRIVAATLASPALDASESLVLEVWSIENRLVPLASYSLLLFYGISAGPVIGPYLVSFADRSWMQYVTLFAFAPCIILLVSLRETHRNTLRRRASSGSTFDRLTSDVITSLGRPFYLLCTQPRIFLCVLPASLNFGTFYAVITMFPALLAESYKNRVASRGLAFLGMAVGFTISFILLVILRSLLQYSRGARLRREKATKPQKEKAATSHIHMDSRTSTMPFRHTPSAMSDLGQSRTASRSSLPFLKVETPIHDSDKNMDVAIAVANYLNDLPLNKGNSIEPKRVLSVLEQSLAFDDVCLLLEGYDLAFDRGVLAATLAETLPTQTNDAEISKLPSTAVSSRLSTPVADDKMWPLPPDSPTVINHARASQISRKHVRPQQRNHPSRRHQLFIILLGSLLSTGGFLMFGWTIQLEQPWIVPVVAMGIVASGGTLIFTSTTEYLMQSSSTDGEHAVAVCNIFRWIFAAALSIASVPLFNALQPEWATSVLGFINAGGILVASILLILETYPSKRSRNQSAA